MRTLALGILLLFIGLVPARATAVDVAFDEGHGQRFVVGRDGGLDLSKLAAMFKTEGANVRTLRGEITDDVLASVDVLVISGPFAPFSDDEIARIERFVKNGGRLAVMLHVAPIVSKLLAPFGVVTSNGVVQERERVIDGKATDFSTARIAEHALTRDLVRFNVYGTWALLPEGKHLVSIADSGPHSFADLNRNRVFDRGDVMQSFSVAVAGEHGKGRVAVFGDDAIFQNQFLARENAVLAKNLIHWLMTRFD